MTYKKRNYTDYDDEEYDDIDDIGEEEERDLYFDEERDPVNSEDAEDSEDSEDDYEREDRRELYDSGDSYNEDDEDDLGLDYSDDRRESDEELEKIAAKTPKKGKDKPVDWFKLMEDYHSDDKQKIDAAGTIAINELEWLVLHILRKKYGRYAKRWFDDLKQSGYCGICKGLATYDPNEAKPSTYFYYYILHEMQDFINSQINKTTSHYDASIRKIKKAIEKYKAASRDYDLTDIAVDTGLPMETIKRCMQIINSTETSLENSGDRPIANFIPSDEKTPEQLVIEEEKKQTLEMAIRKCLDPLEIRVLEMTFGIHGCQKENTKTISLILNIPSDHVRRCLSSAYGKLRRNKELRLVHSDNFRTTLIEIDDENVIPYIPHDELDAALESLRDVDIDF